MKKQFALPILLLFFSALPPKKIKIWLIGDSTMSVKDVRAYPETGWGMPFAYFFDSTVTVDNRARNGRSTKTFFLEGLWSPVVENVQEGDYVLIQFGHNDEVKEKVGSYTTPKEFKNNLIRYAKEARDKKATPVLITPVARRAFDSLGRVRDTHPIYAELVREVARETNVPLIDLSEKSKALLQQLGPEASKFLFNHLEPNEHPNYPDGKTDNTHFSEYGARRMAELVLEGIRELRLELADHVIKRS